MYTTWKELIKMEMRNHAESWEDFVACTLDESELNTRFNTLLHNSYDDTEGAPFTLWTKKRIYFPTYYAGTEWVASVPRNPTDEVTRHIGRS